ncbi:MAG: ribonuclease Y, partial [Armatimonadetes bacterium]|nr:ribonuclease Y [Armatimonadota bacterium]
EQRQHLCRQEERLTEREAALERRMLRCEEREQALAEQARAIQDDRSAVDRERLRAQEEWELAAGLTRDEARAQVLAAAEHEARRTLARQVQVWEAEARATSEARARQAVLDAIQRCAVQSVTETTVSVVALPSDEMKGRIIGREGRNIRAFEALTGVDVIIDDTPEAVVLSAFDPLRREAARMVLERLVADGRIHPARIEELVEAARGELEVRVQQAGEDAALRAGLPGLHPELTRAMGRLRYRTSYGQNVLEHSVEVAHLAGALADELRVDRRIASRAGFLHDVGKALDSHHEGSHLELSLELARRYGEEDAVLHAIEAHHGDVPFRTVEAVLVQIADAISATRPGARREMLEGYLRRMRQLEAVVAGLTGVERSFAVQAGRELRIIVQPEAVDDEAAAALARDAARRIEETIEYPGQIRVVVIRETRATSHAR